MLNKVKGSDVISYTYKFVGNKTVFKQSVLRKVSSTLSCWLSVVSALNEINEKANLGGCNNKQVCNKCKRELVRIDKVLYHDGGELVFGGDWKHASEQI